MEKTAIPDKANKYNTPKLILLITAPSPKGITPHTPRPIKKETIGDIKNIEVLLLLGIGVSFEINLSPSATDCNKP